MFDVTCLNVTLHVSMSMCDVTFLNFTIPIWMFMCHVSSHMCRVSIIMCHAAWHVSDFAMSMSHVICHMSQSHISWNSCHFSFRSCHVSCNLQYQVYQFSFRHCLNMFGGTCVVWDFVKRFGTSVGRCLNADWALVRHALNTCFTFVGQVSDTCGQLVWLCWYM